MKKLYFFSLKGIIAFAFMAVTGSAGSQTVVHDTLISLAGEDWGMSIDNTSDGGSVIVGGSYEIISGYGDAIIVKLDAQGDTMWTKKYGDGYWQRIYTVHQTADNGYIATGNSWDANSQTDTYTIKFDANGEIVWEKKYGGSGWEATNAVSLTNDNSYIVCGRTETYGVGAMPGVPNIYLLKLDANGDTLWTKAIGGTGWEDAHDVKQTADNGYIVVGATSSVGVNTDLYVVKTDANGAVQWERNYGGNFWDEARHVEILSGGGYVVCGFKNANTDMNGNPVGGDFYLLRLDANGDTLWTKTYGGTSTEQANVVRETSDGGFILGGETESFGEASKNGYLLRTDGNGLEQWMHLIEGGNEDRIHDLVINPDGDFLITGWSHSGSDNDVLFVQIQDDGNTAGLQEKISGNTLLFPNPVNDKLYVKTANIGFAFSIVNSLGQELTTKATANGTVMSLDVSGLAEGMYYLKTLSSDGGSTLQAFVISR